MTTSCAVQGWRSKLATARRFAGVLKQLGWEPGDDDPGLVSFAFAIMMDRFWFYAEGRGPARYRGRDGRDARVDHLGRDRPRPLAPSGCAKGTAMTRLEAAPAAPDVEYAIYDVDEHYYEAEDALTRHLPRSTAAWSWVDVEGRRTLIINGELVTVVPNPTYDPVGVRFRWRCTFAPRTSTAWPSATSSRCSRSSRSTAIKGPARGHGRAGRGASPGCCPASGWGSSRCCSRRPKPCLRCSGRTTRWLDEDWGYDRDGRIQTGPMISLVDPVAAESDLALAIEPAPGSSACGPPRSTAGPAPLPG